jgi:hypothetical protein
MNIAFCQGCDASSPVGTFTDVSKESAAVIFGALSLKLQAVRSS